jgi:hypothetical protein
MYKKLTMTNSLKRKQRTDLTEEGARDVRWQYGVTFEAGTGISAYTIKWR